MPLTGRTSLDLEKGLHETDRTDRSRGDCWIDTVARSVLSARAILSPPGRVLSGPLNGGMRFMIPVVFAICYLLPQRYLNQTSWKESMLRFFVKTEKQFKVVAFFICGIIYCFGVSSYWYTTDVGLVVFPGWPITPRHYLWADAKTRTIECYSGKHVDVVFGVRFADGRYEDLAGLLGNVPNRFGYMMQITQSATTNIGSIGDCSDYIRHALLQQKY